MPLKLIAMADVLRAAGLKVVERDGWKTSGHTDMKGVRGILCHHTASAKGKDIPSLNVLIEGRPGLPGPLSQIGLSRSGVWYVIAAGKCSHAGKGAWKPLELADNGNSYLIGIEAENDGVGEPWPQVQYDSYVAGVAALATHYKVPVSAVIGHKEYAPKRKIDPTFDMVAFRKRVAEKMK